MYVIDKTLPPIDWDAISGSMGLRSAMLSGRTEFTLIIFYPPVNRQYCEKYFSALDRVLGCYRSCSARPITRSKQILKFAQIKETIRGSVGSSINRGHSLDELPVSVVCSPLKNNHATQYQFRNRRRTRTICRRSSPVRALRLSQRSGSRGASSASERGNQNGSPSRRSH